MRDNFIYKQMQSLMHSYINSEIQQNSHTDPKLIGLFIPICLIIIITNGNILFLKFCSSTCLYHKRKYRQELPNCLIGFFSTSSPGLLPTQSKIDGFFFFFGTLSTIALKVQKVLQNITFYSSWFGKLCWQANLVPVNEMTLFN